MNDLVHQHVDTATEGKISGQHLKQNDPQRLEIGAAVRLVRSPLGLLGRHVGGGAQDLTVNGHSDFARLATG